MTWNVTANEVDESVSEGGGSATEDSSMAGSLIGSGTARELELGGAEYIDESVSADGMSNCMLYWKAGWGQSTMKSQFQQVTGRRLRTHLRQDLSTLSLP